MSFLKKFFNSFKPFAYSALIITGTVNFYLLSVSLKNKRKLEASLQDDSAKDMTRIGYEFYGINWGYKADFMIKEKVDTGDIFFLKYECSECISFKSIFKCYSKEIIQNDFEYDSIGFAYRDREGLHIIFSFFDEIVKMDYAKFLSQPYFKEISLRKLIVSDNTKEASKKLFKDSKKFIEKYENKSESTSLKWLLIIGNHMTPEEFLKSYLRSTELLDKKSEELDLEIADIDQAKPFILNSGLSFDSKIIIRSKPNSAIIA